MPDRPERPRGNGMPPLVWALLGILVVALFVLVLGLLHPVS
jgi:hypothetical protein